MADRSRDSKQQCFMALNCRNAVLIVSVPALYLYLTYLLLSIKYVHHHHINLMHVILYR